MNGNSETEKEAHPLRMYFDVLAAVARADGRIAPEERSTIIEAARACSLSGLEMDRVVAALDLSQPFELSGRIEAQRGDPGLLVEILRDAFVLAGADGRVAVAELESIELFLSLSGFSEANAAVLMEWGRRAAEFHVDGVELVLGMRPRSES